MKVSEMRELINDPHLNPDAEVKLHYREGNNALFVVSYMNDDSVVVIEDKDDNDMCEELSARYDYAIETGMTETTFYNDLYTMGLSDDEIQEYLPEYFKSDIDPFNYNVKFEEITDNGDYYFMMDKQAILDTYPGKYDDDKDLAHSELWITSDKNVEMSPTAYCDGMYSDYDWNEISLSELTISNLLKLEEKERGDK